ncbi:MAG: diguanylate cyclase, partial [Planctomycetota bacterium]
HEWKLPDAIATPIAGHHTPQLLTKNSTDLDRLTAITYLVGSMRFAQRNTHDEADDFIRDYATTKLNLDEAKLQRCFADAAKMYEQTAALLGETLPDDLDVTELLGQANAQLTAAAGQAEDQVNTVVAQRQVLEAKQAELTSVLGEVTKRASIDPLTGVLNRGALCEAVSALVSGAATLKTPLCIAFLDVDNFKKLNDTYGHKTGDDVLKAVAAAVAKVAGGAGFAGRYGGEEFVAVMPGLAQHEAQAFGESICAAIRGIDFQAYQLSSPVTVSVGVAQGFPNAELGVDGLFAAADAWMYKAKKSGKDRCVVGGFQVNAQPVSEALPRVPDVGIQFVVTPSIASVKNLAESMNASESPVPGNVRREVREKLTLSCRVTTFTENFQVVAESAIVRNLSAGGLSVLAYRPLSVGQPLEAAIQLPNTTVLYMAGVVAHSRLVKDQIHEVGVKVSTTSRQPIFSSNPLAALVNYPWLSQALRAISPTK